MCVRVSVCVCEWMHSRCCGCSWHTICTIAAWDSVVKHVNTHTRQIPESLHCTTLIHACFNSCYCKTVKVWGAAAPSVLAHTCSNFPNFLVNLWDQSNRLGDSHSAGPLGHGRGCWWVERQTAVTKLNSWFLFYFIFLNGLCLHLHVVTLHSMLMSLQFSFTRAL